MFTNSTSFIQLLLFVSFILLRLSKKIDGEPNDVYGNYVPVFLDVATAVMNEETQTAGGKVAPVASAGPVKQTIIRPTKGNYTDDTPTRGAEDGGYCIAMA